MSFRRAAILPGSCHPAGELSGCRALGCPQSPPAPLGAFPPLSSSPPCRAPVIAPVIREVPPNKFWEEAG